MIANTDTGIRISMPTHVNANKVTDVHTNTS